MLNNITIKNFKAITDLTLDNLGQINLLFGENNCGKSSILEAILSYTSQNTPAPLYINRYLRNLSKIDSKNSIEQLFNNLDINNTINISGKHKENYISLKIKCITEENLDIDSEIFSTVPNNKEITGFELQYSLNGKENKPIPYTVKDQKAQTYTYQVQQILPYSTFINDTTSEKLLEQFKDLLENQKHKKTITNILKKIDPKILDISLGKKGNILVTTDLSKPLPIELMGDGIRKAFIIASAILDSPGIILIDEIENGLHHKSQDIVWKAIIEWSKEYNIQFFITTHSYEMIERLTRQIDEQDKNTLKAFRIERKEKEFKIVDYDAEDLSYSTSKRWEIR